MNLELLSAFAVGLVAGMSFGWWRAMVFARKLRHFSVNLDHWAHYDEHTRQAHTDPPRQLNTLFSRED